MTLPHCPFGETIRVPEGSGGRTEEVVGTIVLDDEMTGGLDGGAGVGVGVGVGVGSGASPHRP